MSKTDTTGKNLRQARASMRRALLWLAGDKRRWLTLAGVLAGGVAVYACGPMFPNQLLDDRQGTLLGTPANSFHYEAARLATPQPARCPGLAPGQRAEPALLAHAMADAESARDAAADCKPGKACDARLAAAREAYRRVRGLAACGVPDPDELSLLSLGEQALLELRNANSGQQCSYVSFLNRTPCAAGIAPAGLKAAIRLYAEQTAQGDQPALTGQLSQAIANNGENSLAIIADWALQDTQRIDALVDDVTSRRLLVSYGLARIGDTAIDKSQSDTYYSIAPSLTGLPDAARGEPNLEPNKVLAYLLDNIQRRGLADRASTDRLAALAYRMGRYPLARQLALQSDNALSHWLLAKLALRDGDGAAAVRHYALAAKAFPLADKSLEPAGAMMIKGEQGVLALSRGQYVEALDYLYQGSRQRQEGPATAGHLGALTDYSNDMAYVAERVLTSSELKAYIDHQPVPPAQADGSPNPAWRQLRYLLARRLVREHRIDEALPYFPEDANAPAIGSDGIPSNDNERLATLARQYRDALRQAENGLGSARKAQGWFRAASLAHYDGMELMGYEQDPDYTDMGGNYAEGSGRRELPDISHSPLSPQGREKWLLQGVGVTGGESGRFAASESQPLKRFHYRYVAAGYLSKAADLLPPRSQAFSAVLCAGAQRMHNTDNSLAMAFYHRYVKQGAYLASDALFGQQCPEPRFVEAALFPYPQKARTAWRKAQGWWHGHRGWAAGAAVFSGLAGLLFYRWRRLTRRR